MYSLYSVLVLIVAVIASPWFIYQAIRYKKYVGSLGQRMGYLPVSFNMDGDESIWVHAVSVGEVLTARPLISDLKRRYPNLRMFLSTTTMAGQQLARRSVQDVDAVFYFPFDLGFVVRRTLDLACRLAPQQGAETARCKLACIDAASGALGDAGGPLDALPHRVGSEPVGGASQQGLRLPVVVDPVPEDVSSTGVVVGSGAAERETA